MKKAISLLAVICIAATLVISALPGTAIFGISQLESETPNEEVKMSAKEELKQHIKQTLKPQPIMDTVVSHTAEKNSDYELASNARVDEEVENILQPYRSEHPGMAFEPVGVHATYVCDHTNLSDPQTPYSIWIGSNDDANFSDSYLYWRNGTTEIPTRIKYPDVSWVGYEDTEPKFVSSAVGYGADDGTVMFPICVGDPTLGESWSGWNVNWGDLGIINFRTSEVAGSDDGSAVHEWGIIALCADDGPDIGKDFWMYADPGDDTMISLLGWQTPHNSSVGGVGIDELPGDDAWEYPYYVCHDGIEGYEGVNDTFSWGKGFFGAMDDYANNLNGFYYTFDYEYKLRNPTVEVYDEKVLVATELWILNTTTLQYDKDVIVWHYNYSNPDADTWDDMPNTWPDLTFDWAGGTIYDEENPAIQHIDGETFIVSFTLNDTLWFSITDDAGVSWSDPQNLSMSDFGEPTHEDIFRSGSIGDFEEDDETIYVLWTFEEDPNIRLALRGISFETCPCANDQCGNANGQSSVDIDDVVYLISYIFSGGPPPQGADGEDELCCGDANGMGGVDIDDVVYLISYIFSGGPPPCGCCDDGCGACP
jgi:hypothetical protein